MKFISIILLSLVISVVAFPLLFAQNPNPFNGSIVVNPSAPSGAINVDSVGNVTIGTRNALNLLNINSANGALGENIIADVNGQLKYASTGTAAAVQMAAGVMYFRTFISGNAGATAVPLTGLQINNGAPTGSFVINTDGSLSAASLKATTGTRYVCVDTTGKLISSATACSGT